MHYTPEKRKLPADKRLPRAVWASLLIGLGFSVNPYLARAAGVSNLTDTALTIEVETAQGYKPVVIEAGRTYTVPGKLQLRYRGREAFLEVHEEYAIWPDGTFGPQRRTQDKRGRGWN